MNTLVGQAFDLLNEFLADFPTVSREQAQWFLEQAKQALLATTEG